MSEVERRLIEDRAVRRSARDVFDSGVRSVKADLAARGIGGRIKDHAIGQVREVAGDAVAIARESKGIIAATLAALGLWLLRKPLLEQGRKLWVKQSEVQADPLEDGETAGEPDSE